MLNAPKLEQRDEKGFSDDIRARIAGYLPAWQPGERGADAALLAIAARYASTLGTRLNQAPGKNLMAFLQTAGIERIPAQSARAPIVFKPNPVAADSSLPQRTRIAAPPPPGSSEQIIFETENDVALAAAQLLEVVSVHPGRDQFADYSEAYLAGSSFEIFSGLQSTEHIFYLGHERILNLAGQVIVKVSFGLAENSSERLDIRWEYWDGQVWRPFESVLEKCDEEALEDLDGSNGLTRSGAITLKAGCAETKPVAVNDIETFWVRGKLLEPLPADPSQVLPLVESVKLGTVITRPLQCKLIGELVCVTFESLALDTQYGEPAGQADGDQIFIENGVPVSVHEFRATADSDPEFDNCQVMEATDSFGAGHIMNVNNINLRFDFTALGLTTDYVTFEFNVVEGPLNISINDRHPPIIVEDLTTAPPDIISGVTLTVEEGKATLTGQVRTLLVGGQAFQLDNVYVKFLRDEALPDCTRVVDEKAELSVLTGLLPDIAFADTAPLDLTQTFYPLSQRPQPGSVFYFTSEELFSKPKARTQLFIKTAETPEGDIDVVPGTNAVSQRQKLTPDIVWEYWNGTEWVVFVPEFVETPSIKSNAQADFQNDGVFTFDVPEDMGLITINDEEARWMRVRLVSGGYGFKATVAWSDANTNNEFTYVIPQPPALAEFRLGYTWESAKEPPEATLAYNDFRYEDFTLAARYPGQTFLPFSRMSDVTPALYFGFDKKLPVDFVNLFFDIVEKAGDEEGPALLWEYWDGGAWRPLAVQDETGSLARPGLLALIGPEDAQALARFGESRYWLRARLREDGPPPDNVLQAIYLNAVWASQRQTLRDETIGQSNGLPNQFFQLNQFPVLAGEIIEVRELAGPLAEIEYPILRDELGEANDKLRTVADRNGKVTEVWVRWESQPHLFFSGPEDRHYFVNRAEGRLYFGDGVNGKIPPANGLIMAREYQAGGGKAGNLPRGAINQPLGGVAAVQEVFNALPAQGGADAEPIAAIAARGPRTLRHRGRAMTGRDYEVMAREASPEVAWVRVFAASDPYLGRRPGHVLVMILPETQDRRPWPSFGLRERVREYLEARALSSLCSARCIHVAGPEYFPIDVEVTVVPEIASQAGAIEGRVREALETFLHPLRGGPRGQGWELGRDVFLSDIAAVVEDVPGVDFAQEIILLRDDTPQGERIPVPRDRLVLAGSIRIKLLLP